jgi:L,D-transpeptidase YcbB
MLRRTGCAALAVLAAPLALSLIAGAPAFAQTASADPPAEPSKAVPQQQPADLPTAPATTGAIPPPPSPPATAAVPPPVAAPEPPAAPPAATVAQPPAPPQPTTVTVEPPASPPPAAAAAEQPSPATPTAVEQPPPTPPVDPVLAAVRRQLGEPVKGNVERGDRAALAAFYGARNEPLLWVTSDGFTAKARHAMAEIRKADDWGLSLSAFELPQLAQGTVAPDALASAEIKLGLAALKYARHARGGRLEPSQISKDLDQKPPLRDPKVVLEAMAATETPGNYLRDLNPKHEQFQRLRQALLKARGGRSTPEPVKTETGNVLLPAGNDLKLGSEHPHVAILRKRLGLPMPNRAENIYDLQVQNAVRAFQQQNNIQATGILTPRTRSALNGGTKPDKPAAPTASSEVQRIIVNMERWRWMPEHMGEFHIQDNLPEFMTRVVKKGHVIHSARIVVGKVDTPTAVFSANMRQIVFHPEWGVPDSIKVKELAPYLSSGSSGGGFLFFGGGGGGDTSILERQRLRVVYNGRPVNPSSVDWGQVDIRRFTFIQSAGPHNVLGVVKFQFPNKHDIYMHDTPQRELLDKPVRMYSHGCMRVQDPGRLAEVLLAEDKGWPAEQVRGLLAAGYNNEVPLTKQFPVHVTYFTAVAGEGGQVNYYSDIYGYDSRMAAALGGRPLPPPEIAAGGDDVPREASRPRRKQTDFFSGLFGN